MLMQAVEFSVVLLRIGTLGCKLGKLAMPVLMFLMVGKNSTYDNQIIVFGGWIVLGKARHNSKSPFR